MGEIVSAAIRFYLPAEDVTVTLCGRRYADVFAAALNEGLQYDKTKTVQGFMTTHGDFLDRYEAKQVALASGQLKEDTEYAELYSEDLW